MLQFTLARDALLVGYGSTSRADPSPPSFSGGGSKPGNSERGCRPAVFVGPSRDAHALLCRKIYSILVLRPKKLRDLLPRLFVFHFPESEHVNPCPWQDAVVSASEGQGFVKQIELQQTSSILRPDSDVAVQTYGVGNLSAEFGPLLNFKLSIESFICGSTLREQFAVSGIQKDDFDAFVLHWHEPEIGMSNHLMTTFADTNHSALVSFRGPVWFGVTAHQSGHPCSVAYANMGELQHGRSALEELSKLYSALSKPDLALGFFEAASAHRAAEKGFSQRLPLVSLSELAHGQPDGLMLWRVNLNSPFEMSSAVASKKEDLERRFVAVRKVEHFESTKSAVSMADHKWVANLKQLSVSVAQKWGALYSRTLLTLRQMQDPDGGIIAAPEFQFEFTHCGGYGYCWGRDAGFISLAMDVCGMHAESAKFYKYMAKCQSEDGSFLHRHDMQGNLGSTWGFLQPDETGSVLFGFWQHVKMAENRSLAAELKSMVVQGAHWLCSAQYSHDHGLPVSGFDLWEEREGIHTYSLAAMIAGIQAAIDLGNFMGWEIPAAWVARANELRALLNSEVFVRTSPGGNAGTTRLVRTLQRKISALDAVALQESGIETPQIEWHRELISGRLDARLEADFVVDISQLGISVPFQALDEAKHPLLLADLVERMDTCLWRPGSGGIGRYEGDRYRNGNPWVLTTFWLALAAAKANKIPLARKAFAWAAKSAAPEGMFAEQIDPATGAPIWVMPLTWSHAMFALAVHELPESVTVP